MIGMIGNITLGSRGVNTLPQPQKKYTYDDFTKDVEASGLTGSFSDADLDLARSNPEAGKKIMGYKIDYNNATTDEARATANASANAVRREGAQYHGGVDGLGNERVTDTQPTYTDLSRDDEYIEKRNELMGPRKEFSYDIDKDERWDNYKRQYKSAMETAGSDALARIAAASGGRISTAAARAATQAEAEYMAAMADKATELEDDAYSRWLTEQQLKQQDLENLRVAASEDYQRRYNEREYTDGRGDVDWEKDYKDKFYTDGRNDTEWEKQFREREYTDGRGDVDWEKDYKDKVYTDGRSDTEWEKWFRDREYTDGRGDADWRRRWDVGYTRAQLGDYGKLNEITDATFSPQYSEEAKTTVQKLLDLGYSYEQIMALAGMGG